MTRAPRAAYLSFVRATAEAVFGRRRAHAWLAARNRRLGGFAPLSLAGDLHGAERVLTELDRAGKKPASR